MDKFYLGIDTLVISLVVYSITFDLKLNNDYEFNVLTFGFKVILIMTLPFC